MFCKKSVVKLLVFICLLLFSQNIHADVSKHILAVDKNGNYFPVGEKDNTLDFKVSSGKKLIISKYGGCESFDRLEEHTDNIIDSISRSGKKKILLFIHGGLNSLEGSLSRAHEQYGDILNDGYYPVFIVWRSGLLETYGDQLFFIRNGKRASFLGPLSSPFYLVKDLGETVARAPINWGYQLYKFLATIGTNKVPGLSICGNDTDYGFNHTKINVCFSGDNRPLKSSFASSSLFLLTSPIKAVSTPVVASIGKTSWDNMLRRTKTLFDNPKEFDDSNDRCSNRAKSYANGSGALSIFLDKLSDYQKANNDITVTLAGHSMGAIVANKIVTRNPEINYENIVYMAAADTIANTVDSIIPYMMKPKNSNTKFYNLTLHPNADAREISAYGIAPSGSLLEWIDDMYGRPHTRKDLTMGKWSNIKETTHVFPINITDRIFIKVFGFAPGEPKKHGDFNDTDKKYWQPSFWWF